VTEPAQPVEPGEPVGPEKPVEPDFPPVEGPTIDPGQHYDPEGPHVQFLFGNIEGEDKLLYLQFVDRSEKLAPFLTRGQVTVTLPKELGQLWAGSGYEGKGIERIDDLTFRLVDPDAYIGVKLAAGTEFPVTLDFEDLGGEPVSDPDAPLSVYRFDVVEHRTPESLTNREVPAVGGVTYEINATPVAVQPVRK